MRGHLRQTNGKDMLTSIIVQKRREVALRNESERRQRKSHEREPKQGCQGPYRGFRAKEMARERQDAAEVATAAATASYADPLSTLTASELRQEYEAVTGQRKFYIIKQWCIFEDGAETKSLPNCIFVHLFSLYPYYYHSGTRLRATDKLRTNLHYQNAVTEADDDGFCFPSTTTAELQDALEALTRNDEEEGEEVVEEEVIDFEWEELEEDPLDL